MILDFLFYPCSWVFHGAHILYSSNSMLLSLSQMKSISFEVRSWRIRVLVEMESHTIYVQFSTKNVDYFIMFLELSSWMVIIYLWLRIEEEGTMMFYDSCFDLDDTTHRDSWMAVEVHRIPRPTNMCQICFYHLCQC